MYYIHKSSMELINIRGCSCLELTINCLYMYFAKLIAVKKLYCTLKNLQGGSIVTKVVIGKN